MIPDSKIENLLSRSALFYTTSNDLKIFEASKTARERARGSKLGCAKGGFAGVKKFLRVLSEGGTTGSYPGMFIDHEDVRLVLVNSCAAISNFRMHMLTLRQYQRLDDFFEVVLGDFLDENAPAGGSARRLEKRRDSVIHGANAFHADNDSRHVVFMIGDSRLAQAVAMQLGSGTFEPDGITTVSETMTVITGRSAATWLSAYRFWENLLPPDVQTSLSPHLSFDLQLFPKRRTLFFVDTCFVLRHFGSAVRILSNYGILPIIVSQVDLELERGNWRWHQGVRVRVLPRVSEKRMGWSYGPVDRPAPVGPDSVILRQVASEVVEVSRSNPVLVVVLSLDTLFSGLALLTKFGDGVTSVVPSPEQLTTIGVEEVLNSILTRFVKL